MRRTFNAGLVFAAIGRHPSTSPGGGPFDFLGGLRLLSQRDFRTVTLLMLSCKKGLWSAGSRGSHREPFGGNGVSP